MKTALDRIPTPALVIALAALMGLLVYGVATRGSSDGGPMTAATTPTAPAADQGDDGTVSTADVAPSAAPSEAADTTGAAGPDADDTAPDSALEDAPAAASDPAADAAPGAGSDSAAGAVASGVERGSALPGTARVPSPGSADGSTDSGKGTPNNAADNASELAAFETRDDTLQSELGEVDAVAPTLDQPEAGSLEADARELAESVRDEYFERQLDELEP